MAAADWGCSVSAEPTPLPARILVQIREGKLNLLADFEVDVSSSTTDGDGTITHEIDVRSVIAGLAKALSGEVETVLAAGGSANRRWLADVRDWIFSDLETDS